MGNIAVEYFEKGAKGTARQVAEHHRQRMNDWISQVTDPTRRDYVQTSREHAASTYEAMRREAYEAIEAHRQKHREIITREVEKARKTSRERRQPNPNEERNYRLKAQLATDSQLMERLANLRRTESAADLILAFENSNELEQFLNVASQRPKLKHAVSLISEAFQSTGAEPTDLDRPDVLFALDQIRELDNTEPGTIRVDLHDEQGNVKGRMPVKFDALVDKDRLDRAFGLKR